MLVYYLTAVAARRGFDSRQQPWFFTPCLGVRSQPGGGPGPSPTYRVSSLNALLPVTRLLSITRCAGLAGWLTGWLAVSHLLAAVNGILALAVPSIYSVGSALRASSFEQTLACSLRAGLPLDFPCQRRLKYRQPLVPITILKEGKRLPLFFSFF